MKRFSLLSCAMIFMSTFAGAQVAVPVGSPNNTINTFAGIGPFLGLPGSAPIATLELQGTGVNDINGERILHASLSDNQNNFLQLSNGASGDGLFSPLLWTSRDEAGPSMHLLANIDAGFDDATDNSALMIFGTRSGYNSNPVSGGAAISNRALFEWRNGPGTASLMRMYPGGLLGLGNFTAAPTAQLHTTGTVRFQGLTAFVGTPPRVVVSDANGNLFYGTGYARLNCTTIGQIPMVGTSSSLDCSIMRQANVTSCFGPTHTSIGIGGTPIGTAISGATCYNLRLTTFGSAFASGSLWIASDRKFKKDIHNLTYGLDHIMKLRPVTYQFKTDEYEDMMFPEGETMGFIAQELEEVIPHVVTTTDQDFKAVNYEMLVPVLVSAMQEQQKQIEKLVARISEMEGNNKSETSATSPMQQVQLSSVVLNEASPNPFAEQTTIGFEIPQNAKNCSLQFFDATGKMIREVVIAERGNSSIVVFGNDLNAGVYTYALVVDGQVSATQKLIRR